MSLIFVVYACVLIFSTYSLVVRRRPKVRGVRAAANGFLDHLLSVFVRSTSGVYGLGSRGVLFPFLKMWHLAQGLVSVWIKITGKSSTRCGKRRGVSSGPSSSPGFLLSSYPGSCAVVVGVNVSLSARSAIGTTAPTALTTTSEQP